LVDKIKVTIDTDYPPDLIEYTCTYMYSRVYIYITQGYISGNCKHLECSYAPTIPLC